MVMWSGEPRANTPGEQDFGFSTWSLIIHPSLPTVLNRYEISDMNTIPISLYPCSIMICLMRNTASPLAKGKLLTERLLAMGRTKWGRFICVERMLQQNTMSNSVL
eukprot:1140939-Pelagomonas_calceolata.AAC.5